MRAQKPLRNFVQKTHPGVPMPRKGASKMTPTPRVSVFACSKTAPKFRPKNALRCTNAAQRCIKNDANPDLAKVPASRPKFRPKKATRCREFHLIQLREPPGKKRSEISSKKSNPVSGISSHPSSGNSSHSKYCRAKLVQKRPPDSGISSHPTP